MKKKKIIIIGVLILLPLFWYFSKILLGNEIDLEKMTDIFPSQEIINNIEKLNNNSQISPLELEKKELSDEEFKKNEENKIRNNNILLVNEAGKNGNIESCNDIIDEKYKDKCLNNGYAAKASLNNASVYCLKITDITSKNKCSDDIYYNKAISDNNKDLCLKIIDEDLKNRCYNIIILPIVEDPSYNGTINICNYLIGDQKIYCVNVINNKTENSNFSLAVQSNNLVYCNNLKNIELKNTCSDIINSKKAIEKQDTSLCNLIIDSNKKNSCLVSLGKLKDNEYIKKAISDNNIGICNSIIDKEVYNECLDYINMKNAIVLKDKLLCQELINKTKEKQCIDYFETLKSN